MFLFLLTRTTEMRQNKYSAEIISSEINSQKNNSQSETVDNED